MASVTACGSSGRPIFALKSSPGRYHLPKALNIAHAVFESENMEQQRAMYEHLEPRFLNPFLRRIMRQHVVQSMPGAPKSQAVHSAYFGWWNSLAYAVVKAA